MKRYSLFGLVALIGTACNVGISGEITPTPELLTPIVSPIVATETETIAPITLTPTTDVVLATSTAPPTAAPPTETPTPTETLGPWVYTIQEGDTLGYIIQLEPFNYDFSLDVINAVVRLNNLPSADILPPVGSQILIPRPTATNIPENFDITATTNANLGLTQLGNVTIASGTSFACHNVGEGETIVGIALEYRTTLEILSQLNRDLNWSGCAFNQPGGGPNCNPTIRVGQCINVPQPTPVPTSTPTPNGNETATPTPTYAQPRTVYPSQNALLPAGRIRLQWVSTGILDVGEVYLVEVEDKTTGAKWADTTLETSILLPDSLIPADGTTHTIHWRVTVAKPNADGVYEIISGQDTIHIFQWASR